VLLARGVVGYLVFIYCLLGDDHCSAAPPAGDCERVPSGSLAGARPVVPRLDRMMRCPR
jgi:hypothetical protein